MRSMVSRLGSVAILEDISILDFRFWNGERRGLKALIPESKITEAVI
jgi:hypothetical protein